MLARFKEPLFKEHGRQIMTVICGYELIALYSPLPTISELFEKLKKYSPIMAWVVTLMVDGVLTHHIMVEEANYDWVKVVDISC